MNLPLLSEKQLVLIFCLLFTVSATFLFWQNERELDPNQGKAWWTLSFAEPGSPESLVFTIENFSDHVDFQYQIVAEKKTITEGTLTLRRGEQKTITPTLTTPLPVRTSIIVIAGTEKQEIYR